MNVISELCTAKNLKLTVHDIVSVFIYFRFESNPVLFPMCQIIYYPDIYIS